MTELVSITSELHARKFAVRSTPMGAPRQTRSDIWKPRPCVIAYRKYKDAVMAAAGAMPDPNTIGIFCRFFTEMPEGWSGKRKRKMADQLHRQKPDTDNLLKGVVDALFPRKDQGIAIMAALKFWCLDGEARAEITLYSLK